MAADRTRAMVAMIVGMVLILLALLADSIGVGRVPGFGWKQTLVLLVGLALTGAGWFLRR